MADICMSAQNAAHRAQGQQQASDPLTLMGPRPPMSVRICRAAAFPGTISVKLSTPCFVRYLQLTAARRLPPREVEPVSARRPLNKGVYPMSLTAAATCISCARVAIPVS